MYNFQKETPRVTFLTCKLHNMNRSEWVIVMNENVTRLVVILVTQWVLIFQQIWGTLTDRLSFSPSSIKIHIFGVQNLKKNSLKNTWLPKKRKSRILRVSMGPLQLKGAWYRITQ